MTVETKTFEAFLEPGEQPGYLSAIFSTFDQVDKDGDIVKATAFTHGQKVPLCWSHDWSKPIGAGVVLVDKEAARFEGQFFLDTMAGNEAYKSVKAMSAEGLQEYSWGFAITDWKMEKIDGQSVRVITGASIYEVSPVLVGAGVGTRTVAIKDRTTVEVVDEPPLVEPSDLDPLPDNLVDRARHIVERAAELVRSTKGLHERRVKEGRVLSDRNRTALQSAVESIRGAADEMDAILTASEPQPAKAASDEQRLQAQRILADFQIIQARLLGVPV